MTNRPQYIVDDPLAEELRKLKTDQIIARGQKVWDMIGRGDYRRFMLTYWVNAWEEILETN